MAILICQKWKSTIKFLGTFFSSHTLIWEQRKTKQRQDIDEKLTMNRETMKNEQGTFSQMFKSSKNKTTLRTSTDDFTQIPLMI